MRHPTLTEWLRWQETLHPNAIDLGLDRVQCVWEKLRDNIWQPYVFTVAGTNGKGSTVAMLEAIYNSAGYSTGAYTSPHLLRYNERIRINNQEIDDESLCQAFARVDALRESISLTYFEFGTLAALYSFQKAGVQVVVLEVGLGGRLDAVNIIDADCAIITSIALDHCDWLGATRDLIGAEKAGIFRRGKMAICADPDPPASILAAAHQVDAPLLLYGKDFRDQSQALSWDFSGPGLQPPCTRYALPIPALRGIEQMRNAATALCAVETARQQIPVSMAAIRDGLTSAIIPGRFQVFEKDKRQWILDVSHNPAAVAVLVGNLATLPKVGMTYAIFGVMADKDVDAIMKLMAGVIQQWFMLDLYNERALSATTLVERIKTLATTQASACLNVEMAVEQMGSVTDTNKGTNINQERVVVFGSFLTVAAVLRNLLAVK